MGAMKISTNINDLESSYKTLKNEKDIQENEMNNIKYETNEYLSLNE